MIAGKAGKTSAPRNSTRLDIWLTTVVDGSLIRILFGFRIAIVLKGYGEHDRMNGVIFATYNFGRCNELGARHWYELSFWSCRA